MSLRLRPGLRRVRRAPGRLQVGLDPDLGVVVDGLEPADELLLDALDGRTSRAWMREARRLGVPEPRARDLLARLAAAGVVVCGVRAGGAEESFPVALRARWRPDAVTRGLVTPDGDGWALLAARRTRTVAVRGLGRTGARVAGGLAAAGVGRLVLADEGRVTAADVAPGAHADEDLGRRRAHAVADLVAAAGAVASPAPWPGRPDLAVLVARDVADPGSAADLLRDDVPHLAVVLRERDAVVGPLVVPGAGPCLRCVDLARGDHDPEWPRLVAQLADLAAGGWSASPARAPAPAGEEGVLSALAAALAVAQVVAHLDGLVGPPATTGRATTGRATTGTATTGTTGTAASRTAASGTAASGTAASGTASSAPGTRPASVATSLEIRLPDGLPEVRRWRPHPACGCTWPPAPAARRRAGAVPQPAAAPATSRRAATAVPQPAAAPAIPGVRATRG